MGARYHTAAPLSCLLVLVENMPGYEAPCRASGGLMPQIASDEINRPQLNRTRVRTWRATGSIWRRAWRLVTEWRGTTPVRAQFTRAMTPHTATARLVLCLVRGAVRDLPTGRAEPDVDFGLGTPDRSEIGHGRAACRTTRRFIIRNPGMFAVRHLAHLTILFCVSMCHALTPHA